VVTFTLRPFYSRERDSGGGERGPGQIWKFYGRGNLLLSLPASFEIRTVQPLASQCSAEVSLPALMNVEFVNV
jgi:hypothetical protein